MRVKQDFVTNSSTTCFIAYGHSFETNEIYENEDLIRRMFEKDVAWNKEKGYEVKPFDVWRDDMKNDYGVGEYLDGVLSEVKLNWASYYDADCVYIGRSPWSMEDGQTMKEFQEDVKKAFEQLGFKDLKLYVIEEAWRDG